MIKSLKTLIFLLPLIFIQSVFAQTKTEAEQVLELVNSARAKEGLSPVVLNQNLNIAAEKHSQDMLSNRNLTHTGSDGSQFSERAQREGYQGSPRGENVAVGYRNAEGVHNGWMTSSGHRRNILNPSVNEMGLGRAGNYWTQIFGRGTNINPILSTNDFNINDNQIKIAQNPAFETLKITKKGNFNIKSANLFDLSGSLVKSINFENSSDESLQSNIADLTSGTYFLQIEGTNKAYKIIKR